MDRIAQENRTFQRYDASRVVGLGECRGPQARRPIVRQTGAPSLAADSEVVTQRQRAVATTTTDPLARYVDGMDGRSQSMGQNPVNSFAQNRSNCHSANTGHTADRFNSLKDSRSATVTGTTNDMMFNPMLNAELERMERVKPMQRTRAPRYAPSQSTFQALQLGAKGFHKIRIVEQLGQDFASYSTPWEQKFSSLIFGVKKTYGSGRIVATPVVDHKFSVVAHVIKVTSNWCWRPKQMHVKSDFVHNYLQDEITVYVDWAPMDGWKRIGFADVHVTLLVAIDGEVLLQHSSDNKANVVEYDGWLLDVLQLGGGLAAGLGRGAIKRSVKAIHRRTTSKRITTLTGRTKEKAKTIAARAVLKPRVGSSTFIPESGMTRPHFRAVQQAVKEENVIAVMRNTSTASTPHIARGNPAKPLRIKANTDPETGVVTGKMKSEFEAAMREGYFISDGKGMAYRTVVKDGSMATESVSLRNATWKVKPGQFIQGGNPPKPLVGDYDLMGVFPKHSTGSNVARHSLDAKTVEDISGPYVSRLKNAVNAKLDCDRIMHGAQCQFSGFRGGATVFYPDGRTLLLRTEDDVRKFYSSIGRKTANESYNSNTNSAVHQAARKAGIASGKIVELFPAN